MTVSIVLGGGGAGGWMFHAGVLRALQLRFGFDPAGAEVMVGTSAGSSVAAGVKLGVEIDDIVAQLDRPPTDEEMEQFRQTMEDRRWQWRPLQPALLRELLPGGAGAGVAVSGLLPPGRYPTWPLARITGGFNDGWPAGLWITATDISDGSRVVFGRDSFTASVGDAIEASSALPGLMEPKQINGSFYVDGGAVSPSNADLAAETDARVAIISSPMTRPGRRPLGVLARRRLADELRSLEAAGLRTVLVEPPPGTDEMFRAYPRRDRSVGRDIRLMGELAAEVALVLAGVGPADLA